MSGTAIDVQGIGKAFSIGPRREAHDTLAAALAWWARAPFRNYRRLRGLGRVDADGAADPVWALRDVSFTVRHGEVLGIVGRNGAGKSTLLKILSRIVRPTAGRAVVHGRVASLLEVGTGFHPELTGRENVYMNGTILGMRKREIDRKLDEIVDFSGVERFIDTPIKRYSSGMTVRLAFAVAAHLEPEILVIDEVLAVGDVAFQNRCLGKMDDVARQGRTVFFVSHNMASVKRLCTAVLHLSGGRVADHGEPSAVIGRYLQESLSPRTALEIPEEMHRVRSPLQITAVEVLGGGGRATGAILRGDDVVVRLAVRSSAEVRGVRLGVGLHAEGNRIATLLTPPCDFPASDRAAVFDCRVPGGTLLPGFYELHLGAHSVSTGAGLDWVPAAVSFGVAEISADPGEHFDRQEFGVVRIDARWEGPLLAAAPAPRAGKRPHLTPVRT